MSTRSIVYGRTDSGIKGVYVHWDGYPEGRLPVLHALIARDGVDKVMSTLLARPSGWSSLHPEQDSQLPPLYSDGRFEVVPGYGIQYSDVEMPDAISGEMTKQGDSAYRTTSIEDRVIWVEFLYVIEPDGSITWAENFSEPWDTLKWRGYSSAGEYTGLLLGGN